MQTQSDLSTWKIAPSLHWMEAFAAWLHSTPSQKNRKRDIKTLEAYLSDVRQMSNWYQSRYGVEFDPSQMNSANAQEFFQQFENTPSTYRRKKATAQLLVKWSRLVGALGCDPLEWIACPEMVEQAPRDVLPDEERRLRDVAESFEKDGTLIGFRDSLIFHLMLDAGLRVSEVIEMKLSDLDFDNEKIHVLGKGKKHRWVYMRKTLNQRIRNWLDRKPVSINDTLITSESGSAIRREEAYRRFVRLADSANVKATPHYMRHQFVMNYMAAYMRGDPSHFAAALTAASQETGDLEAVLLKYYTGPRESDMRAAMDAM